MPDISELVALGGRTGEEKWYVDRKLAAAGELQLWHIRERTYSVADQVVAIALVDLQRSRGVLVESKDIPTLYDLLRGIVKRGKL